MKIEWKHVVVNVCVTFVEGFLATLLATGNQFTKQTLVGAVAAAISLVWNTTLKPLLKQRQVL